MKRPKKRILLRRQCKKKNRVVIQTRRYKVSTLEKLSYLYSPKSTLKRCMKSWNSVWSPSKACFSHMIKNYKNLAVSSVMPRPKRRSYSLTLRKERRSQRPSKIR